MAAPTVTSSRHRLGPCEVVFNSSSLGSTLGGVEVRRTHHRAGMKADQLGEGDSEIAILGDSIEVTANLAEYSLSQLATLMPGTTLVTDAMDPTKLRLRGDSGLGSQALRDSLAKTLVLKPIISNAITTDELEWLTIPKAFPSGDFQFSYSNEQRAYRMTFIGLPDSTIGNQRWYMGYVSAAS